MKSSYPRERIIEEEWQIPGFKLPVPTFIIKPIKTSKKVLIYIPGLNGNGVMVKYFNYPYFDNCYLFSLDMRAQGSNTNSASKNYKKYINDIFNTIQTLKQKYPEIEEFYLCGESWGSTLSFIYSMYYPETINGVIGWNMPYDVVDVSEIHGWKKFKNSCKVLWTYLTNINTYDTAPMADALTNNALLKRIVKTMKNNKLSNRVILAAWKSFKKAYKALENPQIKVQYIQSLEDALLSKRRLNYIKSLPNVKILDKGFHILTFDDNVSDELFLYIKKFIY